MHLQSNQLRHHRGWRRNLVKAGTASVLLTDAFPAPSIGPRTSRHTLVFASEVDVNYWEYMLSRLELTSWRWCLSPCKFYRMSNGGPPPWGERLWKLPHRGDMARAGKQWEHCRKEPQVTMLKSRCQLMWGTMSMKKKMGLQCYRVLAVLLATLGMPPKSGPGSCTWHCCLCPLNRYVPNDNVSKVLHFFSWEV